VYICVHLYMCCMCCVLCIYGVSVVYRYICSVHVCVCILCGVCVCVYECGVVYVCGGCLALVRILH